MSLGDSTINGQVLLKYLPAAYQEDPESRAFLEKFLGVFGSQLDESERLISDIPSYFDPLAIDRPEMPDGILSHEKTTSWLAGWLSLELYELLGNERNKEYLLKATDFYKRKGTPEGLADLVAFLTGRKTSSACVVKEYINNVFRSYGMEHCSESNKSLDCTKLKRQWSRTLNTDDPALLADMRTVKDRVHYTLDSSEKGLYSPHSIGLYITVSSEESLKIDDVYQKQLLKIIESFLPAFMKVTIKIITIADEAYPLGGIDDYKDHVYATEYECAAPPQGEYSDEIPQVQNVYTYPYTYPPKGNNYLTNDRNYWTYMALNGRI